MVSLYLSNEELKNIPLPKAKPEIEDMNNQILQLIKEIENRIVELFDKKEICLNLIERLKNRDLELIKMTIHGGKNKY
jgi:hypothetical protein